MLSYLLLVLSSWNHSGFVNKNLDSQIRDEGTTGGLIVKMGPVTNVHVAVGDVRVWYGTTGSDSVAMVAMNDLPAISQKGKLVESFSANPVHAIRYGK
jgi:hypothetical protein